jgi:hypothetical protein
MGLLSRVVRLEAIEIAEGMVGLMPMEDARLAAERTIAQPYVGEDALALLATPGTLARSLARSLESTARKGIAAHAVGHGDYSDQYSMR